MTTGCYKGLGRDTLIQMRTDTLSEIETLRKGKRISSASMSGKSSSKSLMTTNELRDELKEIDYALRSLPSTDLETGDIGVAFTRKPGRGQDRSGSFFNKSIAIQPRPNRRKPDLRVRNQQFLGSQ